MPYTTESNYTGDNSNKEFTITFPFLTESDVKVRVKPSGGEWATQTATTHYSIAGTVLTFVTAPAASASIQIFRDTDIDKSNSVFQSGSSIRAQDLNNLAKQFLYAAQEFEQASTTPSGTGIALTAGTKNHIQVNSANDWTIVPGSLTTSLGENSVDSLNYVDGSIDNAHLAANSVDSDQYVDGSIDLIHMSANSVDSDQYVNASVDLEHLSTACRGSVETPVGTVIWYAGNSAPTGYLKCNGDAIANGSGTTQGVTTNFAALYAIVGGNLPDLRGEFIRGWDDSRGVDGDRNIRTTQGDLTEAHTHSATTANTALTGSITGISESWHNNGTASGVFTKTTVTSRSNTPQHVDSSDTDGFSFDGGHSHTTTISSTGGAETRPRNYALLACIKY